MLMNILMIVMVMMMMMMALCLLAFVFVSVLWNYCIVPFSAPALSLDYNTSLGRKFYIFEQRIRFLNSASFARFGALCMP